jgi:hypothetical protein
MVHTSLPSDSTRRASRMRARPTLRAAIDARAIVKSHLALTLDVTPSHLSHILAGRRTISQMEAAVLADLIGESLFTHFELAVDRRLASPGSNGHGDGA